ncbi:DNA-directed DNA polymerase alpha Required for mitotic DNA synthesis, premeiotic DNA synthesis, recombination, and full sporulation [Scheffersomyces stipitis CBS 6054]|uniref:DNA polymerase n=1 Tax=Scheffersomyces stipitis (strain ATCC 58785 / CBS 6054 / NBRC 10063 / NRRL Y-11545) TaxID=322104 RepID=A3GHL1_PICST|nr:DNA-directed DNA polymerase alpha Required for mitotic DNA synthesis, premeiotic DNA synthesis, recombination, and full sporulation [Scheffersomyces stipitis CBS 6054]EAZ62837.2 DNA-directed DNA polymerase alpha Required for mitotic DNA synthesis, premeiotic DNA synthesis, recombination, and full sporulation [Scheffersomyces stipitis CBS 6054]
MSLRASKREKLKQLREARKTGASVADFAVSEEEDLDVGIYDEVDEETYREHKRKQLMNDDFIVDDNGEGYVDNGVDEWDDSTRPNYYSDEEEAQAGTKRKKKSQRPVKVTKVAQISNYFKPAGGAAPVQSKKVDANIDDILDDFADSVPTKKKAKREVTNIFKNNSSNNKVMKTKKKTFNFSTSVKSEKSVKHVSIDVEDDNDSQDFSMDMDTEEQPSSPIKKVKDEVIAEEKENIDPSTKALNVAENESVEESDDSEDEIVVSRRPRAVAANKNNRATFSSVKAVDIPSSSPTRATSYSQINYTEKLDEALIVGSNDDKDSFKMFWLDYCEVDSSLLLFGKILTREGNLVSGVVKINGLCRELYFLPRKFRLVDDEEDVQQPVTALDVNDEVTPLLLHQFGLDGLRAKPEKMKYAFELAGIPKETEYLKILLPFKTNKNKNIVMPSELEGETFSHVFGTNASIFEAFVLQRNIMGPCWIEVSNGDFNSIQNTSHCQVEVSIDSPSYIKPISEAPKAPNLTVTSIAVQTVMNPKQNKQEVVAVSLATFRDVPQDAPIDENLQPSEMLTIVRPVNSATVPPGLQQLAEKQGLELRICPNEKVLLNLLCASIKRSDPDVFIGHRLENISLDVLVQRMYDFKISTYSALGRRNRKSFPERFGRNNKGFGNNLLIREIFQGRLLCDIANEMGQSLTSKCQSWELPEMYDVVCKKKHLPIEINYQSPQFVENADVMLMALKDNASNVQITAEIAFSIQILSLSKQLTNIAGNAWSHTLSGTRAGRNEFILLHEFKRNNYIVPDKEDKFHKNANHQQEAKMEATEDDATTVTSNKKPKYQGGLVFEPEKGLHKNYILVMDFNSLYPSIIQEFNICFTTVDRDNFNVTHDEDRDMPSLPERDSAAGVLPRLLNSLVSRRREVKKLLKDPKNTPFQRAQYDIRQQALKLTANSMYGCLGYINSRFYAKPLAMLVTNKGREILMDTRQLAESIGLRVVYGDTDSVMIDTGVDDFQEAIKIGEQFKLQVNERYRLLEIDIDNVFKRLLLHAKKKYAAMNASINSKTGEISTTLEVKGLDMRRREYCQLSKEISAFVLMKILSDLDPEKALGDVYDYLEEMSGKIKNNEIAVDKYKINTKLSKDPNNYPNGKSMPQVQVALKLRSDGKVIKAGSVITYVITAPKSDDDKSSPPERARAIHELLGKKTDLKPDANYYLEKQIFAPVERLLERIEGIDMVRVAKCLDIDTKKFILRVKNSENTGEITSLEASVTDSERFRQASFLVLNCKCGKQFRFGGIIASRDYSVTFNGVTCNSCSYNFPVLKLTAQLEGAIRKHISVYYSGWLVCDDNACGITTRQISVYGKRCIGSSGLAHGCKGIMRYKYSDKALYNQLLYFNAIFDVDKAKKDELRPIYDAFTQSAQAAPTKLASGQVAALAEQNRELFGYCQDVVQKYLQDCGRRYVNMGSIFDFMGV